MYNLQCDVQCTRDQRLEQTRQAEIAIYDMQRRFQGNTELVALLNSFRLTLADYRKTALGY